MSKAIVIGAGFGGMASALRLKAKGYDVTIIDRGTQLGGRAKVFKRRGFIFDAGPTVITAPFLIEELFSLFNRNMDHYVKIVPVEPWYRFYYPDGDHFNYGGTLSDTLAEIARISPKDTHGYQSLLRRSQAIFEIGFNELADKPFHQFKTMLKHVPDLIKLKCFRSVWQMVSQHLEHDKLRQAFSIQPLLVGGNPFDTTCIYNLIHFLEHKWGIHFAMGGTGALVSGLEKLMQEVDITIQLNTSIEKLNVKHGKVISARTSDGHCLPCDLAVSNVDPKYLYNTLLSASEQTISAQLKTKHAKLSMGLYVLYVGTTKQFDHIAHHTIWLGKRYRHLLQDIFNGKSLPDDFSLYVHRPTATDASMAPQGCDSFYILSPVPNLTADIDWHSLRGDYATKIINALNDTIMPGLQDCIVEQFDMTPLEFKHDYLSEQGCGFSIAPTLSQSAWFRYHNQAEGPDNLFLVGAGTHPGAGIPGVLSSAKVLDHLIPDIRPSMLNPKTKLPSNKTTQAPSSATTQRSSIS